MDLGMLWFDNNKNTSLAEKIKNAAGYYRGRYKRKPDICFVHPSMIKAGETPPENIELRTSRSVLPNHLWIGMKE